MCLGVPMQVVETDGIVARCARKGEERTVGLILVGEVPVGGWVLVHMDRAVQILEEDEVGPLEDALEAILLAARGEPTDHLFADIPRREDAPLTTADDRPVMTCRTCGAVYDPQIGDPLRGVPERTPFEALPDYWLCPGCGGPQHGFAPEGGGGGAEDAMDARVAALIDAYRRIDEREMGEIPICNRALAVEAVGFREFGCGWIGVVIAPWFLNAVLLPRDPGGWGGARDGDKSVETLPSGEYAFTAARLGALGMVKVIPLVSAMNVFADQAEARSAARLAISELLRPRRAAPADKPAPEKPAAPLSRRALFGRGGET